MRHTVLVASLLLVGCQGARIVPGPAPTPAPLTLSAAVVLELHGSGSAQTFVGVDANGKRVPFSALVEWSGNGKATGVLDASGATLYLDGDASFLVTPAPNLEGEAQAAIDAGRIRITRDGKAGGLDQPVVGESIKKQVVPVPAMESK